MSVTRHIAALLALVTLPIFTAAAQTPPPSSAPAEAIATESGIAYVVITPASGTTVPDPTDHVVLEYTGWGEDGQIIDSTAKHPDVRTFQLAKLFPALREAVAPMRTGERRRIWIPAALAPKKAPAVFEVELLDIRRPLDAPSDVAAAPADAEKTRSGIAWKTLRPGSGTARPKAKDFVVVHYTGWTTDGMMFDSSFRKGAPGQFLLTEVIPGWREILQLMTPGERRRVWIPQKHAYGGERGFPKGTLVFDIELLRFH